MKKILLPILVALFATTASAETVPVGTYVPAAFYCPDEASINLARMIYTKGRNAQEIGEALISMVKAQICNMSIVPLEFEVKEFQDSFIDYKGRIMEIYKVLSIKDETKYILYTDPTKTNQT